MRGNLINTFYKTNETSDDYSPKTERKTDFSHEFCIIDDIFSCCYLQSTIKKKQFTGKIFFF
jgi:hypothetical protein